MSTLYGWSEIAVECYSRHCICSGCSINDILETECGLKKTVLELYTKFGKPIINTENNSVLNEIETNVYNAILDGAKTKQEIAKKINRSTFSVQAHLPAVYDYAKSKGWRCYKQSRRLPELVKFLQSENIERINNERQPENA